MEQQYNTPTVLRGTKRTALFFALLKDRVSFAGAKAAVRCRDVRGGSVLWRFRCGAPRSRVCRSETPCVRLRQTDAFVAESYLSRAAAFVPHQFFQGLPHSVGVVRFLLNLRFYFEFTFPGVPQDMALRGSRGRIASRAFDNGPLC